MPDITIDAAIADIAGQLAGSPAPTTQPDDGVAELASLLAGPVSPPHTPLDNQASQQVVQDAVLAVSPNRGAAQQTALSLSKWDDWTGHVLKNQPNRGLGDQLANTTDVDIAESMHRFLVSQGGTFDASVLKGDRLGDLLHDARQEHIKLMLDTGWKDVASPAESREVFGMVLFKNMLQRTAPTPARWSEAARTTFDTAVEDQRRSILNELGTAPAGQTMSAEVGKRLHAAGKLAALDPATKEDFVRWSYWQTRATPVNDQEEDAMKAFGMKVFPANGPNYNRFSAISADMAALYGTSEPEKVVTNLHDKVLGAFQWKDAGFINGDITNHGVLVVDKNMPGGMAGVDLLPFDTLINLEKKTAERAVPSALSPSVDETTLSAYTREYGEEEGKQKLFERMALERYSRIKLSTGLRSRFADPRTESPTEAVHLTPTAHAMLWVGEKQDQIMQSSRAFVDGLNKATKGTVLDDAGKIWVAGVTRNPRIAQNADGILDAASLVLDTATETGRVMGTIFPSTAPIGGEEVVDNQSYSTARSPGVGVAVPTGVDGDAFRLADPGLLAEALRATNRAPSMMAQSTEAQELEQAARNQRMGAYQAGKQSDTLGYMKDIAGSVWYQAISSIRNTVGELVDRPGDMALVWAGNKLGEITVGGIAQARTAVFGNLANAAMHRQVAKVLARFAPRELEVMESAARAAIRAADTPDEAARALRGLATESRAVLDETLEAQKSGALRASDGTVNRFAWAFSRAYQHLGSLMPTSVQALVDAAPVAPSSFGWARARDVVRDYFGSMPQNASLRVRSALADSGRRAILDSVQALLGRNPKDFDLMQLRGDLVGGMLKGDSAAVKRTSEQISNLVGGNRQWSPLDNLTKLDELDKITTELKTGRDAVETFQRALVQAGNDARRAETIRPQLIQAAQRVETLSTRENVLRDELSGGKLLDGIDRAQLLIAQDTGKLGYGAWMRFTEKLGNGVQWALGHRNFESLKEASTAADQLLSFANNNAADWFGTKMRQAGRMARSDLLYRRAVAAAENDMTLWDSQLAFTEAHMRRPDLSVEESAQLLDQLPGMKDIQARKQKDLQSLKYEYRRMLKTPAGEGWDLGGKEIWKHLSQQDVADIITQNPEWFDHFNTEGLFAQASPQTLDLVRAHKAGVEADISRLGRELDVIAERKKAVPKAAPAQAEPAFRDEFVGGEDTTVAAPRGGRQRVTAESLSPQGQKEFYETSELVKQRELRRLQKLRSDLDVRLVKWGGNPGKVKEMLDLFEIPSADKLLVDSVDSLRQLERSTAAQLYLRHGGDAFTSAVLPFHLKGHALSDLLETTKANTQATGTILEALADKLNNLAPDERRQLVEMMHGRGLTEDAVNKHPDLAWRTEQARPSMRATPETNLEAYTRHEAAAQASLIEDAHAARFIDDAEYEHMKRAGYDPGMYGLYERPRLINTKTLQKIKEGFKGEGGSGPGQPLDASELQFKRHLTQHRVYTREADGFIHDQLFDSREAALEFIDKRFGSSAKAGLSKYVEGRAETVTTAGDRITLAEPIGREAATALDFLEEGLPERRLSRFAQLNRDLSIHRFLTATRGVGGMVLSRDEFVAMAQSQGKSEAYFLRQYSRLPDMPKKYGDLAGTYVHRKVLTEMNAATHSFEQLRAWVDGLMQTYSDYGDAIPAVLAKNLATKTMGAINKMVKTTQILMNWRTWVGNVTFNIMADQFTGGKILAAENIDNFIRSIKEVTSFGNRPRELLGQEAGTYLQAIRDGVLNGSVFDRTNTHLQRALLRAAGFDDAKQMIGRRAQLMKMREELAASIRAGSATKGSQWEKLTLELTSIEEAMREQSKGVLSRLARESYGLFFGGETAMKLPKSELGHSLRQSYGMVDDVFRYATYLNLQRQGKSAAEAAWTIRTFMQNYGNLPSAISALSRNPLGAMVPAFPYELMRLTKNYATYKPLRLMAMLSVVPAVNLVGAGLAGVPLDRVMASMRAQAQTDTVSQAGYMMSNLMIFNPRTHSLESTVGLSNTALPFQSLVNGFGPLSTIADKYFPREEDTVVTNVGRSSLKFLSNYILNNPVVNTATSLLTGNDPVTGRPLFDPGNATWGDISQGAMRVLGRSLLPPWTPVLGRIPTDIGDARGAPLHPETGRPYGADQIGTVLSREATSVPIKGKWADDIANFYGLGKPGARGEVVPDELIMINLMYSAQRNRNGADYGKQLELFGSDADKRRFWAQLTSDASTETEKALAIDGLKKLAAEEKRYLVAGTRYARGATEREQAAYVHGVMQRGSLDHFQDLDVVEQTLTLVAANNAAVNPKTVRNYLEAATLTDRYKVHLLRDPGLVVEALKLTEAHMADPRGNRPEFLRWHEWLVQQQEISGRLFEREKLQQARLDELRKEGRIR